MALSWKEAVLVIGVIGLIGPVLAILIRHVSGPAIRVFNVHGKTIHCLSDTRGIRIACDDQVIFATGTIADIFKSSRSTVTGDMIRVSYLGGFPRLSIVINDERLTGWPFSRAEWWARFLAGGWIFLNAAFVAGLAFVRFWYGG